MRACGENAYTSQSPINAIFVNLPLPAAKRRQTTFGPRNLNNSVPGPWGGLLCSSPQVRRAPRLCQAHSHLRAFAVVLWTSHSLKIPPALPLFSQSNAVLSVMADAAALHATRLPNTSPATSASHTCGPVSLMWGLIACLPNPDDGSSPACCSAFRAENRDWNEYNINRCSTYIKPVLSVYRSGPEGQGTSESTGLSGQRQTEGDLVKLEEPVRPVSPSLSRSGEKALTEGLGPPEAV